MPLPISAAVPSSHNGGKFQFNFWFQSFGSNHFPFIDVVKLAQTWVYGGTDEFTANTWVIPRDFDVNGYPTQVQSGGYFTVTNIPPTVASGSNLAKPGPYVLRWEGTGTLWVTGQADQTGTNGRFVFTPSDNTSSQQINFGVRSMDAGNRITKISIYALSDEPAYLAGEIWNPDFIARLNESRPGVLRFMDWLANNTPSLTKWADRKPIDYFSQGTAMAKASWWKGTATLTGTQDFVLNTGDSLTNRLIYQIRYGGANTAISRAVTFTGNTINDTAHPFSNGDLVALKSAGGGAPSNTRWSGENLYIINSATNSYELSLTPGGSAVSLGTINTAGALVVRLPTLSIDGGTTKKPIRNQYGDPIDGNLAGTDGTGHAMWATLIYDEQMGSWLNNGTTSGIAGFFSAGTSVEYLLDLCVKIGAHPWINFPFLAVDPMTDYVVEFATYLRDNAPFWMVPRFEGPNEQWNGAGGFYATRYAWNMSWVQWGIQFGGHNWQGKINSTIAQDLASVYGTSEELNGNKYQMLNGFQTVTFSTSTPSGLERLTASTYLNQAAPPQSGYSKIAPHYLSTHITVANYFSPTEFRTGTTYTGSITSNVLTTTVRLGDSSDNPKVGDKLYYPGVSGTVSILSIDSFDSSTRLGTYTVSSTSDISSQTIIGGADNTEAVRAFKYAGGDTSQLAPYLKSAAGPADGRFNLEQNKIFWNNALKAGRNYRNKDGFAQRITAYEGGYSPDETGTAQVNSFRADTKDHVDCGILVSGGALEDSTVINGNFNDFIDVGGEYPSQYLFAGRNVWSALDPSIYITPDPPIWNGIKAFNV